MGNSIVSGLSKPPKVKSSSTIDKLESILEGVDLQKAQGAIQLGVESSLEGVQLAETGNSFVDEVLAFGDELSTSTTEFFSQLKENGKEAAFGFLDSIDPDLARNVEVLSASLPELVDGLKTELIDAAPGLLVDAALAIGGALLSPVSAGAGAAISIAAVSRRIFKTANAVEALVDTAAGVSNIVENLDGHLSNVKRNVAAEFSGGVNSSLGIEDKLVRDGLSQALFDV